MHLGNVSRVDAAGGIWVVAPALDPGAEIGPCLTVVAGIAVGDRVALDQLQTGGDQYVVLGRVVTA
jgi:hypothetical protein